MRSSPLGLGIPAHRRRIGMAPSSRAMRAVQIIRRTRGPRCRRLPEPEAGPCQQLYDVSTAAVNYADTHHRLSPD